MKEINPKSQIEHRALVIGANIVIVAVILTVLLTFFKTETSNRQSRSREQFESVVTSVAQTITGRLESHQTIVDGIAHYINEHDMTIEEAIDYAASTNTMADHMFHIVWTDDFTGLSTQASKLDENDYTVDYTRIESARFTGETIITAMSLVCDENTGKSIHATRAFNNPTNAVSTIAYFDKVQLKRNGAKADAIIMLLTSVDDLREEYSFPEGIFEDTQTAMIDSETGYYVLPNSELKNSSFFEYLLQYNDIDYNDIKELKTEISENGEVARTYLDYKGNETRFIISNVSSADEWAIVSFLPVSTLNTMSDDNLWSATISLIALITILLVFDMWYFLRLNKSLSISLESEKSAKAEAVAANRSKTDFLSTMSHDIRTPLNAIIGFTTLTKGKADDKDTVLKNLDKIEQSGSHLLTLINDILDITKIESGKLNFNVGPFSLEEVGTYLRDLSGETAREKGIEFNLEVNSISNECLLGDKLRIYQVMINILSNAIKYTNSGGLVNASLTEDKIEDGMATLRYVVSDTGIGMSEEFMSHMYEAFSRAEDGRISKVQGTGLGLAICKRIIDAMGGTIECESKPNVGTTFTIMLKFPLGGRRACGNSSISREDVKNIRILVAEDNDLNWEIVSEMLDIKEIECERAENGQIAVDLLKAAENTRKYNLVLMDIQMPVMNGLEATKAIRACDSEYLKKIPIIALTADAFTENIEECKKCGMNSHVAKPINMEVLMAEIDKLMV